MIYKCPIHELAMPEVRMGIVFYCHLCSEEYTVADINRLNNAREAAKKRDKKPKGKKK